MRKEREEIPHHNVSALVLDLTVLTNSHGDTGNGTTAGANLESKGRTLLHTFHC